MDGQRPRALLPGELAEATAPAGVAIEGGSAADRRAAREELSGVHFAEWQLPARQVSVLNVATWIISNLIIHALRLRKTGSLASCRIYFCHEHG